MLRISEQPLGTRCAMARAMPALASALGLALAVGGVLGGRTRQPHAAMKARQHAGFGQPLHVAPHRLQAYAEPVGEGSTSAARGHAPRPAFRCGWATGSWRRVLPESTNIEHKGKQKRRDGGNYRIQKNTNEHHNAMPDSIARAVPLCRSRPRSPTACRSPLRPWPHTGSWKPHATDTGAGRQEGRAGGPPPPHEPGADAGRRHRAAGRDAGRQDQPDAHHGRARRAQPAAGCWSMAGT